MISITTTKSTPAARRPKTKTKLLTCILILSLQISLTCSQEQQQQHAANNQKPIVHGCRTPPWQRVANKCIRIFSRPLNHKSAMDKCIETAGSHLAFIDDSTNNEREALTNTATTQPFPANLTSFLSQNVSDQHNKEITSKQFYVNISANLMEQYRDLYELGDSESSMSELWFSPYDKEFAGSTGNFSDPRDHTAFALVYSKLKARWGILPVSPAMKKSFLCERDPISASNSVLIDQTPKEHRPRNHHNHNHNHQHSTNQNSQPQSDFKESSESIPSVSQTEARKPSESILVKSTTPSPETSSMLFRETPQDKSVILGTSVELRCSSFESDNTLTWTYNGRELISSSRIKLLQSGNLRIEHVRYTDEGSYTCKISSAILSESKTVRLEIVGRPHPPEDITAELFDKLTPSVRIRWTPEFNGNSPIVKYSVEMKTVNSDSYETNSESGNSQPTSNWEIARVNISADQNSVIINDLKPARKYIFRIKATNKIGTSEPSQPTKQPIEVPTQPPSMPPSNLIGTPRNSTSISLQWSPPPIEGQNGVIKGYKIRHKLDGYTTQNEWITNEVTDGAHMNFILDDLIVWQNYEIQVAAENEKDVGPFSHSIFVKTKEGTPDKGPRNVTCDALSSTSLKVNWIPPSPQHINGINQGYRVQVWLDFHQTQLAREEVVGHNATNTQHTAVINDLIPYTEYYITVKCFTNAGDGPPNEETVKVKTKQDFPEIVSSFEFDDVLDKSLKLVWKPPIRINGELDHYTLEYSENVAGSYDARKVTRTFPGSLTEAVITDLMPQTPYVFRIFPHTNVGQGPGRSINITTSVPPVLPEPPTSLVYSNIGATTVSIQFNPGSEGNAAIDKWIVEALITPQTRFEYQPQPRWQVVYVSTNHTKGNSIIVRNLKPFTRYKLRLSPVNIVGQSRFPSDPTGEFQTAQMEPERAPNNFVLDEITSTSMNAHWQTLQPNQWFGNPIGYNLSWHETNNPNVANYRLINDSKVDTFRITELEEFTDYSFKIFAINEAGSSAPSETVLATTLEDVPSAGPSNITANAISYNTISVDWFAVPKKHRNGVIRGFKIQYQALREGAPLQVKTVEDNTTKHVTLNDLKAFTSYHLAVAAFTSAGDGVYSNVLSVRTHEDTPGIPQNLSSPTFSQTTARILWDPPTEPNGEIVGYKVSYHLVTDTGNKEVFSQELHHNERTFKATNLKPSNHYLFTVSAKTKEGWGQQASTLVYTYDSTLRANLPFYRESWFVILCACLSIVITIIITALLFVQSKSYKYKQDAIKQSTSHDRLGDAGFTIDDELVTGSHYNNGFGLLSQTSGTHRRSNGALSQTTANFTLPKTPPRPHPGSVIYSDDCDDDVFEDVTEKGPEAGRSSKNGATTSNYDDSSGDSIAEKPSEISSSPAPDSETADDDDYASKHFSNHYANVTGSLRHQKHWRKSVNSRQYGGPSTSSSSGNQRNTKPKLPQRPVPSVPHVPGGVEINSSGSDNTGNPMPGTSGIQHPNIMPQLPSSSMYGDSSLYNTKQEAIINQRDNIDTIDGMGMNGIVGENKNQQNNTQQPADQLLNGQSIVNLNGGRIIVDNMAGSRAPLPGFTSFV